MNIFVTNTSPQISAQALDNRRVIKMILESAQLLSTALFLNSGLAQSNIYKPTHLKHPCTIWTAMSRSNWDWLFEHLTALCEEYSFRYGKIHATEKIVPHLLEYRKDIKDGLLTDFVNCTKSDSMNVDFRQIEDPCKAYRLYMIAKWNHDKMEPKWTNRGKPEWYNPTTFS